MGFLDSMEKLITEHGSATIQEKHISLLREEYAVLERKARELEMQKNHLETQLDGARKEITRLNNIIEATSKDQDPTKLSKVTEQILEYFYVAPEVAAEDVSQQFNLNLGDVSYHFGLLLETEFIVQRRSEEPVSDLITVRGGSHRGRPATFSITQEGRRYVVEIIRNKAS